MTPGEERAYLHGERAVWVRLLGDAARALGHDTAEGQLAALLSEREEALALLRSLHEEQCEGVLPERLRLVDAVRAVCDQLVDQVEAHEDAARERREYADRD